jgi:uncharacterized membrane protein
MIKTKDITLCGMYFAILALLSFTPLGYITIFTFAITTIHIVVLVAAFTLGVKGGLIVGLGFGIMSLLRALIAPTSPFDAAFINPVVSVLPRVLFGLIAGTMAQFLPIFSKKIPSSLYVGVVSCVSTFFHTDVVLLAIIVMRPFIPIVGEVLGNISFFALFASVFVSNAFVEVILAALVVPLITAALRAQRKGLK